MPNPKQTPEEGTPTSDDQLQDLWNAELARRAGKTPLPAHEEPSVDAATPEPATPAASAAEPPADDTPAPKEGDGQAAEDPIEKRFALLEQEMKRATGRIAALQSEQAAAAKRAAEQVSVAPTQKEQAAALKSPAKWDALKKEFPEWGEAIDEVLAANMAAAPAAPADLDQQVEARVTAAIQQREIARVERRHPGWLETVKTEEFKAWREKQTAEVQALGASDLSDDAIEMLDLFAKRNVKSAKDVQAERAARLAAAASTPRAPRPVATPRDDSELTPNEIWRQEAQRRAERKKAAAESAWH